MVKNVPANAGDAGSVPGLERSPGVGNGNPLQYLCLESPRGRGAWWAAVYGVAQSQTRLKQLSSSSMYGCESWSIKKAEIVELESPLDSKEIKPVNPKGNQS